MLSDATINDSINTTYQFIKPFLEYGAFNDIIPFSNVNLNDGVHDVHWNQCISNTCEFMIFLSYSGQDDQGRIRLSIPRFNPGFSYLVFMNVLVCGRIHRGTTSVLLLFVCVEVLRPSQPSGVMSSAVSLPNLTFTGQT